MNIAFGGIYDIENNIDPIPCIVVSESDSMYARGFVEIVDILSDEESDRQLFALTKAEGKEEAIEALKNKEAEILFLAKEDHVEVLLSADHSSAAGIVSKTVADMYNNNYRIMEYAYMNAPQKASEISEKLMESVQYTEADMGVFSDDPDPYTWYFFSTLVMGIFFNAMTGVHLVTELKADTSFEAMRLAAAPERKSKMIWYAFFARLIPALAISAVHLLVMRLAFHIPLGRDPAKLIFFIVTANIFAISFGVVTSLFFKGSINARENKTTAILMISVFLSGEMVMQLPGAIEQFAPVINDINPATIMNMAFYRMAMYNDMYDFYFNMGKLIVISTVFLTIGVIVLRREKYASL